MVPRLGRIVFVREQRVASRVAGGACQRQNTWLYMSEAYCTACDLDRQTIHNRQASHNPIEADTTWNAASDKADSLDSLWAYQNFRGTPPCSKNRDRASLYYQDTLQGFGVATSRSYHKGDSKIHVLTMRPYRVPKSGQSYRHKRAYR